MKNSMDIDGYQAVIQFDPDIEMFRGEFVGLNGGADFYARDIAGLKREGLTSLNAFLDMCREDGVEPRRQYSGKFNVRISPELHANIAACAAAAGKSLNQWVSDILSHPSMLNEMSKLLDELQCKDLLDQDPRLPPEVDGQGIYVFYEDNRPLYVGRSDDIRTRIQIHSRPSSSAASANFAFILTRDDWNIWDGPYWRGPLPKAGSKEDIKRRIVSKEGADTK